MYGKIPLPLNSYFHNSMPPLPYQQNRLTSRTWQVLNDRNTGVFQVICISHARKHEKLRRIDGSSAQDHFFIGKNLKKKKREENSF